jgi:hypothetical protein
MATDNTPPRLKLIVTIAVITVITLIGINFVTESYYAMMTDQAQREKIAPTHDREEQHKAEMAAFTSAALPIEKAIAEVGKGDRPALITPQQSDDLGPMTGWSKLPKPAPTPHPHVEPPPAAPEADGGAALAGDAGASELAGDAGAPQAAGDAGAPHAAPADAGAPHAAPADAGAHPGHH